jgi:hypothetical protein
MPSRLNTAIRLQFIQAKYSIEKGNIGSIPARS